MRLEEAYEGWTSRRLTQAVAAMPLGWCVGNGQGFHYRIHHIMARPLRLELAGALYHVTSGGHRRSGKWGQMRFSQRNRRFIAPGCGKDGGEVQIVGENDSASCSRKGHDLLIGGCR
jgi:hypothetical protein